MAPIDRAQFAKECLNQADIFGAYAHYMLAVAQLRSKIDDAKSGNLFGPFGLSDKQWSKQRVDPSLNFADTDISDWKKQCALFACWTHKVHAALATANGQDPTAEDLYTFEFPGDSAAGLDQALTDTKGLMPAPAAGKVASADSLLSVQFPA